MFFKNLNLSESSLSKIAQEMGVEYDPVELEDLPEHEFDEMVIEHLHGYLETFPPEKREQIAKAIVNAMYGYVFN